MCFDVDSTPPDLPSRAGMSLPPEIDVAGGTSSGQRVTLTSADGATFAAYVARPEAPNGAGIVILPDVRGLFSFYEQLAARFAVAGVEAIAIDYFGRTAGMAPRANDFDYMPHVKATKPDQMNGDIAAAVAYLRGMPGVRVTSIFTVGFCFGGGISFAQAANQHGLAGVIGFYGSPLARPGFSDTGPIDRVNQMECPVLGLFGGADQGIPVESVHRFDQALTDAGVEHSIHIYPNAPHSFFDRKYEEYQAESADSWNRMLDFIGQHTV